MNIDSHMIIHFIAKLTNYGSRVHAHSSLASNLVEIYGMEAQEVSHAASGSLVLVRS